MAHEDLAAAWVDDEGKPVDEADQEGVLTRAEIYLQCAGCLNEIGPFRFPVPGEENQPLNPDEFAELEAICPHCTANSVRPDAVHVTRVIPVVIGVGSGYYQLLASIPEGGDTRTPGVPSEPPAE